MNGIIAVAAGKGIGIASIGDDCGCRAGCGNFPAPPNRRRRCIRLRKDAGNATFSAKLINSKSSRP